MNAINHSGSQVFSMQRFAALLKTYFIENGKTLGLYTATLIGLTMLVGYFCGHTISGDANIGNINEGSLALMIMYVMFAGMFGVAISASLTFSSLQTRASRIATLMVPASMLEKFLVRIVVYLFAFAFCFIVAVLCGEGVRILFSGNNSITMFSALAEIITLKNSLYVIASVLTTYGFYALGSAMWPKYSFFKSFVVQIILQIILGSIMLSYVLTHPHFMVVHNDQIEVCDSWLLIALQFAFVILFFGLAWWRFSKTQIVQRFMMD